MFFKKKNYTLGLIPEEYDNRDYQISNILSKTSKTKNKVDYTKYMSPIKDQKNKGACVGFSIAAMLEYQQYKEYLDYMKIILQNFEDILYEDLKIKNNVDFSEQGIYHKSKEIDNIDEEGTTLRDALTVVNKYGVLKEKYGPYSDIYIGKPKDSSNAKGNKNKKYYRIQGLEELKESLYKIGPCPIGVLVHKNFLSPNKKGIIKTPKNNEYHGGHAICCVGYDDNKELIKFKNSWGMKYGKNGYAYLPYDYINKYMISAWVSIDEKIWKIE